MRDDDKTDLTGWLGLRSLPDYSKSRWLGPAVSTLVVLTVGGLFVLALASAFVLLSTAVFGSLLDDPRSALGVGGVTVALIGAPFVIWRSVVAQKTVNVTEQGHITDRINTAVQGLGAEKTVKRQRKRQTGKLAYATGEDNKPDYSQPIMEEVTQPNLEVRIGAIYALERIAQDSDRDHVQIMEILCAYIRQNAPAPETDDWPKLEMKDSEDEGPPEADFQKRLSAFLGEQKESKLEIRLPEDIQTALTVIGRRSARQRRLEAGRGKEAPVPFDRPCPEYNGPEDEHDPAALDAYRQKLDAWKATLSKYVGYRLDLRGADLRGADLRGADLSKANLNGAQLTATYLQGADLMLARLQGAMLSQAQLQVAGLGSALLQGAMLWRARLQGAGLGYARLQDANLGLARLQGAGLAAARLQGAQLGEARLQGASLRRAQLDEDTYLKAANLRGAALRAVQLTEAPQIAEHLPDMFGDASVTLPDGHGKEHEDWPKHWPTFMLEPSEFLKEWQAWQANPSGYIPPEPPAPQSAT